MPVKWLKRFHLAMMGVWALLAIPGFVWWSESVLFVIALSLYANFAGEFAAYQGARSEEQAKDSDEDQARLERRIVELQASTAVLQRKLDTLIQVRREV